VPPGDLSVETVDVTSSSVSTCVGWPLAGTLGTYLLECNPSYTLSGTGTANC